MPPPIVSVFLADAKIAVVGQVQAHDAATGHQLVVSALETYQITRTMVVGIAIAELVADGLGDRELPAHQVDRGRLGRGRDRTLVGDEGHVTGVVHGVVAIVSRVIIITAGIVGVVAGIGRRLVGVV